MDGMSHDTHLLHGGDSDITPGNAGVGEVLSPSPQDNGRKRGDAIGLRLLVEAQAACLVVRMDGERLVIRGPRSAEQVAQLLLQHKAQIVPLLAAQAVSDGLPVGARSFPSPAAGAMQGRGNQRGLQRDSPGTGGAAAQSQGAPRARGSRSAGRPVVHHEAGGKPDSNAPCPRCGATKRREVPIHGGKSVRRDCAKCGRFLCFPVWYGKKMDAGP